MLKDMKSQIAKLEDKKKKSLSSGEDGPDKLLQYFTKVAIEGLHAERCSIFIVDPDTHKVWLKAGTGLEESAIEVKAKKSIVGRVIQTGETVIETDLENKGGAHRATDEQTGFVTHNMITVPILDPGALETVGAVQVLNKKDQLEFGEGDEAALKEIAEHIQTHVYLTYLDQEIYTLSERVVKAAQKSRNYLLVATGIVIALAIAFVLFR